MVQIDNDCPRSQTSTIDIGIAEALEESMVSIAGAV